VKYPLGADLHRHGDHNRDGRNIHPVSLVGDEEDNDRQEVDEKLHIQGLLVANPHILTLRPSETEYRAETVSQYFKVHPINPQSRLLRRAAEIVRAGGIIVYPTDSCYALGWHMADKQALEKVRLIRHTERDHDFTLVCRDLSDIGTYARVDNWAYRLLRSLTPGPYTFILRASGEVPKRLQDPKRRSIGIRIPAHKIVQELLKELGEPLMSSTLLLPGEVLPLTEPEDIRDRVQLLVDCIIDGGACGVEPTSVIDLSRGEIAVLRKGKGDVSSFAA
jgi:tRNA threonylcarbamoyl adenosine modification protein (Sua5/YciO/YrdC/YwlC family)